MCRKVRRGPLGEAATRDGELLPADARFRSQHHHKARRLCAFNPNMCGPSVGGQALQCVLGMGDSELIEIRCGSCGRRVRVPVAELTDLRTYDCPACRQRSGQGSSRGAEDLREVLASLTPEELSILLRRAAGFPDQEIVEAFGVTVEAIQDMVKRLERRFRSSGRRPEDGRSDSG